MLLHNIDNKLASNEEQAAERDFCLFATFYWQILWKKRKFSAKLTTWTNHSVWKLLKKGLILQHFTISQWPSQNMIQKLCFLPDFRSRRELCFLPLTKCTFSRQIAELSKFWLLSSSYRQNQNWNYRMSKIFLDLISIFKFGNVFFSFSIGCWELENESWVREHYLWRER